MRLSDDDDWMSEPAAAEEFAAIPDPGAEPAARDWFDLARAHRDLEAAQGERQPGRGRWTPSGRRAAREATAQAEELRIIPRDIRDCAALLAATAAGSTREWDALSVIPRGRRWPELSLERTLSQHRRELPSPWVDEVLEALPQIRAEVQLQVNTHGVDVLHHGLLDQAAGASAELATALREHLPGPLRPIPSRVAALQRRTAHVTLYVSEPQPNDWDSDVDVDVITLSDIVVHGKGRGLGTAVLTQLCRYADATGSSIIGDLIPGPSVPAEQLPATARWYARHGFTSGSYPPEQWRIGSRIRREPRATPTRAGG
ncbi:MAG: hypothetical protein L0H96_09470 [Humibacillus sp.]|nr:hypothetical protein [Humibacillus sp.]MDN5777127.1 hypothetical protein [Humibacillus sp.]